MRYHFFVLVYKFKQNIFSKISATNAREYVAIASFAIWDRFNKLIRNETRSKNIETVFFPNIKMLKTIII